MAQFFEHQLKKKDNIYIIGVSDSAHRGIILNKDKVNESKVETEKQNREDLRLINLKKKDVIKRTFMFSMKRNIDIDKTKKNETQF